MRPVVLPLDHASCFNHRLPSDDSFSLVEISNKINVSILQMPKCTAYFVIFLAISDIAMQHDLVGLLKLKKMCF
jgi:hypothetical protein